MAAKRVVVLGARGVFGSLLVRELADKYDVVPQGRGEFDPHNAFAVACTAGPFQSLDRNLARIAVEAGAHWLDIADDEGWFFDLVDDASLDALAREKNVAVIPGLSSLPAVSGALVRRLGSPKNVTITLHINNRNAKGAAAIASAAASGGRTLRTPDRELLRRELGVDAEAHVEFESALARPVLRLLGRWPRFAAKLAKPFRFGKPGGAVEVRSGDRMARIESRDQRLAILPVIFALQRLDGLRGCLTPGVFDGEELLSWIEAQ